jgi:hypothetical protein
MRRVNRRAHRRRDRKNRFSGTQEGSRRQKLQLFRVRVLDVLSGLDVEDLDLHLLRVARRRDAARAKERHAAESERDHFFGAALAGHAVDGEEEVVLLVEADGKLELELVVELALLGVVGGRGPTGALEEREAEEAAVDGLQSLAVERVVVFLEADLDCERCVDVGEFGREFGEVEFVKAKIKDVDVVSETSSVEKRAAARNVF